MNAEQILRLVEIGSAIGLNHDEAITKLKNLGVTWKELHSGGVQGWKNVAQGMTEVDLVAIVKSLVLLDTTQEYSSGSAAPAIWLFQELTSRRFAEIAPKTVWRLASALTHAGATHSECPPAAAEVGVINAASFRCRLSTRPRVIGQSRGTVGFLL